MTHHAGGEMEAKPVRRRFRWALPLAYGVALYFFYVKYVPLIKPFQIALGPVLLLVFVLTTLDIRRGTLCFIFLFPLINNLPYFFGIDEFTPHAPSALVLFLFYGLGWLVQRSFAEPDRRPVDPIFKPMLLFTGLLLVSAIVTFFRYANFYPFQSDSLYELVTNAFGVTAGGAIQSVIFSLLLYLSGFAFFFVLWQCGRDGNFSSKILVTFCLSCSLSLSFGLIQHVCNLGLGNNPTSKGMGLMNATFKDAMSFGTFLAMAIPFFLGICLAFKGIFRAFSLILLLISGYMILFAGSKSAFLSLVPSLVIFLIFAVKAKRLSPAALLVLFLIAVLLFYAIVLEKSLPVEIAKSKTLVRLKDFGNMLALRTGALWKIALSMAKDFPLTGVGLGAYIIETSNYADLMKLNIGTPESAENLLLHIGAELGVIGIILMLWILWDIAKQIHKRFRKTPPRSQSKFVLLGAAAGTLAFWINAQTHTYIGSYEIHYTYWLLIGLIFAHPESGQETAGRDAIESGHKRLLSRNLKRGAALVLVLYGAIHLWNSTHSLSLRSRTETFGLNQDFGFSQPEKTKDGKEFRWASRCGGTTLKIEKPVIVIPLLASHPDIRANPVKVKIELTDDFFKKKKLLGEIVLSENVWIEQAFAVPEEMNKKVIILLKASRTWNPHRATGAPDSRNLGVAVGKIKFKDEGTAGSLSTLDQHPPRFEAQTRILYLMPMDQIRE